MGLPRPALLLDLADGAVVAELRGSRGAPLGDGRLLLGLEGYDVFDTWEHDRAAWHRARRVAARRPG